MPREDHRCDLYLPADLYQRIEAWRQSLPVLPSLPDTLRALLAKGLDHEQYRARVSHAISQRNSAAKGLDHEDSKE